MGMVYVVQMTLLILVSHFEHQRVHCAKPWSLPSRCLTMENHGFASGYAALQSLSKCPRVLFIEPKLWRRQMFSDRTQLTARTLSRQVALV